MQTTVVLQAALNGDRIHPAAPRNAITIAERRARRWRLVATRCMFMPSTILTGLEDITLLPDGKPARDNADLVAAAARLIHESAGRAASERAMHVTRREGRSDIEGDSRE